jgi:alanine racemase
VLRPAWLEINLSALADNIHNLKSVLSPHQQIIAVIKANAYGHGAYPVARVALEAGASRLAVAIVEEALELREQGIAAPIMLLGATPREAAPVLVEQQIEAPLTDVEGALALAAAGRKLGKPALAHLKIDSGMHRLGVRAEEVTSFCEQLRGLAGLEIIGVFTHFSSSQIDPEFTLRQLNIFKQAVTEAETVLGHRIPLRHVCNSGATVRYPEAWLDAVRPGALLYGIPRDRGGMYMPEMRPVLALKARLSVVKPLYAGESVGYDRTWQAPRDTRVGLLPVGYADGWDRLLSNRAAVLVHGQRCPIVGRICMDTTIVDLTPAPDAAVDDVAVLIGTQGQEQVEVHEIAALCDTVVQEVVSRFSARLPRVYYAEPGDERVQRALADQRSLLSDAPLRDRANSGQHG